MTNTKKITLATVKSFIKKNSENLYIKCQSSFDGMIDGISYNKLADFQKVILNNNLYKNTLGISGAWFVGSSRDYFNLYEENNMICISVSNSCGSFVLSTIK